MCKICCSREFIDYTVDKEYANMRLATGQINMGTLGKFINELNIILNGEEEEVYLESCVSLNNDADICDIQRIQIKYCPFCGQEL